MKMLDPKFIALTAVATFLVGAPVVAQEPGCVTAASADDLAGRSSPLDSISFTVSGQSVKVCYGRPSARGRTMIGGSAVPFGQIWRTGANEPTMIHTPVALSIAGIQVEPGTYALYTVPNETEWQIVVNRSYSQWGRENFYTAEVEAQEVDRANVPASEAPDHVEQFTISFDGTNLVMAWEHTLVPVPIAVEGT
jgi:hypothetical protein